MANSGDVTDALDVLGNEIRVSILRELAEADGPLSFTELRKRAGIRDTGKFNYHLTKLCSYFVREADGGYELGHAGSRVIAAADPRAGTAESEGREPDAESCPVCGEADCEKLFHVHLEPPWR
ncbi:winged helix-turn-helix domain-containing protein [Halorussus gelatinilyticus]|uniref:Winged helix-turn-helix domain-containing protein n=1 Tax=Halorussus gelatinilyticus TaxID=2937524 RepID=A0A8U0IHI4_9EURY|nr:helix-turn-helix domain-containing protein [Halorussus gelatinilyticus]UPW00165.1 winged helix-turn-helix domain-containing protein [Halorussus gelatinilyticus]